MTYFVVFLVAGLLCCAGISQATTHQHRYRYGSFGEHVEQIFTSEREAYVEYESSNDGSVASSVQWAVGDDCVLSESTPENSTSIIVTCAAGKRTISMTPDGDAALAEDIAITFETTSYCYDWYSIPLDASGDAVSVAEPLSEITYRLWIVEWTNVSEEEWNRTATSPSARSRRLSLEYWRLGETPFIEYYALSMHQQVSTLSSSFNSVDAYWEITVRTSGIGHIVQSVRSKGVSILNCSVGRTTSLLSVGTMEQMWVSGEVTAFDSIDALPVPISVISDTCAPNVRLLMFPEAPESAWLWTQDGFVTVESVVPNTFPGEPSEVLSAVLSNGQVLLLTSSDGIFYWDSELASFSSSSLFDENSEPLSEIPSLTDLRSLGACDPSLTRNGEPSPRNDIVVSYGAGSLLSSGFFVSYDSGTTFARALPPVSSLGVSSATILTMVPQLGFSSMVVVAQNASVQMLVILSQQTDAMDCSTEECWEIGYTFSDDEELTGTPACSIGIESAQSGSGEFFVFGSKLFYFADGGFSAHPLSLVDDIPPSYERSPSGSLGDDECVVFVSSSYTTAAKPSDYAVLTTAGRVFYGTIGLTWAIEVQSGSSPLKSLFTSFLLTGQLAIWRVDGASDTDVTVEKYIVPVENEVVNVVGDEACPYMDIESGIENLVYLDIGDTYDINLRLVPTELSKLEEIAVSSALPGSEANAIFSVIVSDATRLSIDSLSQSVAYESSTPVVELAVSISENSDDFDLYEDRLALAMGLTDVRVAPSFTGLSCATAQDISVVHIGCPPGRHIVVDASGDSLVSSPSECDLAPKWYNNSKGNTLFTVEEFGCPMEIYHGVEGWKPTLKLYDGDEYIQDVDADFVVWEIQDRSDFTYNATMADAGCLRKAQTWSSLERQYKDTELENNRDEWWYASNYDECYVSGTGSTSGTYEILNATGSNAIAFDPTGRDGFFAFKLRVVDPDMSYCVLETAFALDVYGAPLEFWKVIVILFGTMLGIFVLLLLSYIYYRQQKLHMD
eukprot:Rmarinus@m.18512